MISVATLDNLVDALATAILANPTTAYSGPNQRLYSALEQMGYFNTEENNALRTDQE